MSAELVFMTTNRAKLAHLKYLGRKYAVQIHGFHERTYHGSYTEPRINERRALLERSYFSALQQWNKAGLSADSLFFLEDTSVRIEALSQEIETPGVDIKYWMRQMSIRKLNNLLEKNGGNRTVSVRSDIVAHIPISIRKALAISDPFIWVHGISTGSIVEKEEKFSGNLAHPWLDTKTFNRWFVPTGCDKPLSMLPVEIADLYDFRATAFRSLLAELKKLNIPFQQSSVPAVEQYCLPGFEPNPPVMVVCGYSCAGKTTIADWLGKQYGFLHIEASDYMYRAFRERHGISTNVRIGDFAEAALKDEPSIAARPIADFVKLTGYSPIVITGFRSSNEIVELKNRLRGITNVFVVFIEADFDTRLERAIVRHREPVDAEKLLRRDGQEDRMGLSDIRDSLSEEVVSNMGKKGDLNRKFAKFFQTKYKLVAERFVHPGIKGIGPLEALILQSMLFGRRTPESCWTTTETARLIGAQFGIAKEKDNISRYFNQEFRPFYEIDTTDGKAKYKLSTTGESIARIIGKNGDSVHIKPSIKLPT